jgi:hypothetical protein
LITQMSSAGAQRLGWVVGPSAFSFQRRPARTCRRTRPDGPPVARRRAPLSRRSGTFSVVRQQCDTGQVNKPYRGSVLIGEGVQTDVAIADLDSPNWSVDFPSEFWKPASESVRRHLVLRVELLDGPRSGQSAWADLVINEADDSARMTGQFAFSSRRHGPR